MPEMLLSSAFLTTKRVYRQKGKTQWINIDADGNYRVTIDSELVFYQVNAHNHSFSHKLFDRIHYPLTSPTFLGIKTL